MNLNSTLRSGPPAVGLALGCLLVGSLLTGCNRAPAARSFKMPPPQVGVVTITSSRVPLKTELPGRLEAYRIAQVRARVTGIVLKRQFEEGSDVKAGQVLFQIDPAPFQAAYDSARADQAKAEATLQQAQVTARRYKALLPIKAVSQQDYDNAQATVAEDQASVQAAKAAVQTAALNLGYATVTSPIAGRIGATLVTEGALVSQSSATEMAVVQQLDPIYCDFTQSSADMLRLRREVESGQFKSVAPGQVKVTLILEDGTVYPHPGKLLFSDVTVDPTTGMVTVRALFPNPDHLLLPGMFVRGELEEAVDNRALTAPQRAVSFGAGGVASVMVVTPDNKVEPREIQTSTAIGSNWLVTKGLKAGEKIIVDGLQKVRPGMVVKPVPFAANGNQPNAGPASPAAPATGQSPNRPKAPAAGQGSKAH